MYPTPSHGKGKIKATVWDITAKPTSTSPEPDATLNTSSRSSASRPPASCFSLPEGVQSGTVDVITVIYVLSALHPNEWEQAVHNLYTVGHILPVILSPASRDSIDLMVLGTETRWSTSST